MASHKAEPAVVVIGASAGGLQALLTIVERLPKTLPACVLIAMHSSTNGEGVLSQILARTGSLPVAFARNGDPVSSGRIFVAPGDFHLLVGANGLMLAHGPRENGFRPAVDPLFRTAARELGRRVIGVILSGALSDGTYGLSLVKHHGGVAIVQDPDDAQIPSMPQSAIDHVAVDHVLPAADIAGEIVRISEQLADGDGRRRMPRDTRVEPQQPSTPTEISDMEELFGEPSALTCPDCGGALWQVPEGGLVRYQCHVGHQYAPENLEAAQRDAIDGALWSAVRVLEEHAELKSRMARRAAEGGLKLVSDGFEEGARDAHEQAQRIRSVLFNAGNGNGARVDSVRAQVRKKVRAPAKKRKGRRPARARKS